ncbi:MAG: hypothetical protein KAQ84_04265 [Thermoplasmatales archaeon]|nr:hypothetical protein [Thermoplasmatales archaeon]MCK5261301.1 hypothetical protein [Thermoplasmatales archaeon]
MPSICGNAVTNNYSGLTTRATSINKRYNRYFTSNEPASVVPTVVGEVSIVRETAITSILITEIESIAILVV